MQKCQKGKNTIIHYIELLADENIVPLGQVVKFYRIPNIFENAPNTE